MMTADEVLKAFGGGAAVAKILNVTDQAVSNMKGRGTIPPRHWRTLVDEAQQRAGRPDVTPEQSELLNKVTLEMFTTMLAAAMPEARAS